jgi:hypothetical protein
VITVPKVPHLLTHARTIESGRARAREVLGRLGEDARAAELVDDVELPAAARRALQERIKAKGRALQEQARAARAEQHAVALLTERMGLSRRDAGVLLGVSYQRVQQIMDERREDELDQKAVREALEEQGGEPTESWEKVKAELGLGGGSRRTKKVGARSARRPRSAAREVKNR